MATSNTTPFESFSSRQLGDTDRRKYDELTLTSSIRQSWCSRSLWYMLLYNVCARLSIGYYSWDVTTPVHDLSYCDDSFYGALCSKVFQELNRKVLLRKIIIDISTVRRKLVESFLATKCVLYVLTIAHLTTVLMTTVPMTTVPMTTRSSPVPWLLGYGRTWERLRWRQPNFPAVFFFTTFSRTSIRMRSPTWEYNTVCMTSQPGPITWWKYSTGSDSSIWRNCNSSLLSR